MTMEERLARIEEQLRYVREDVAEITAYVRGPLEGRSVSERLHKIENDSAAAVAAQAALDAARVMHEDARERGFSRTERIMATLLAFVVTACSVAALALNVVNTA